MQARADLSTAKDEVAAGRAGFGEHHMTIGVRGATPAEVDAGIAEVQATLADLGAIAVREEIALEPAFWAQFPANFRYIARRGLVSTSNFAGLASGVMGDMRLLPPYVRRFYVGLFEGAEDRS